MSTEHEAAAEPLDGQHAEPETGTLRDRFAAAAVSGLLAAGRDYRVEFVAAQAYRYADALLAERDKGPAAPPPPSPEPSERSEVTLEVRHDLTTIGKAAVDWSIDTGECHMCSRTSDSPHDADCPIGLFLAPKVDDVALDGAKATAFGRLVGASRGEREERGTGQAESRKDRESGDEAPQ